MATSPINSEQHAWDDDRVAQFIESYHERLLAADDASAGSPEAMRTPAGELDDSTLEPLEAAGQVLRALVRARAIAPDARPGSPSGERGKVSIWEVLSQPDGADQSLRQLGRFSIVRELGRGGFAVVFLAVDPVLNRQVALKVPRPAVLLSEGVHLRFDREAQAVARLTHPNLIPLFEVGTTGAITYIVSAYCAGPSMAQYLQEHGGRLEPREAARLVKQLADAAHYAHTQGVLHRDIKPGNVMLEPAAAAPGPSAGEETDALAYVPKLVDFGLARLEGGDCGYSRTGIALGTPGYMAPEQAEGRAAAMGPATDVYGLGALLYEALTGNKPFESSSTVETLRRVLLDDPPRPREKLHGLSRDLEAICLRCLEKRPSDRYASAKELADDLHRFLAGEATHARPLGVLARAGRWARRRPTAAALVGVSCAAALALLLFGGFHTYTLEQSLKREQDLVVKLKGMARPGFMRQMQHLLVQGDGDGVQRLVAVYNPAAPGEAGRFDTDYLAALVARKPTICAGHEGETYGVTFSPDGQTLFSAGADKTVRLWRTATGALVSTLTGHTAEVNSVCVTPDGRWLFSVDDAGEVRRWDARTGEPHGSAAKVDGRGYSLALSRDAKHLWCIGETTSEKTSNRWSISPDGLLADRSTFASGFDSLVPLEFEQAIGVRFSNGAATIGAGIEPMAWIEVPGKPSCIDLDALGNLACGGHTGWISTLRADNFGVIASWRAHDDMLESLSFWPKNQALSSASRDASARTWDPFTGALLDTFCSNAAKLWCVAISPHDEWLAVAGDPRGPLIWRIADRRSRLWNQSSWKPAESPVSRMAMDRDGTTMALGLADGTIVICDAEHGTERHRFRASDQPISGLWWSASGQSLAAEGAAGDVSLWQLVGTAAQKVAVWHIDGPIQLLLPRQRLCFAGATERLLIGPIENQLRLVDAATGKTLAAMLFPEEEIHQVAAPAHGGSFVLRFSTGQVIVLDDVTLRKRVALQTVRDQQTFGSPREQHTFACSPHGELIATLVDQSLHLWSTEHGTMVASIAFDAALVELAFSAKDDLLAVGLADDSIRIVDLTTREETLRLPGLIQGWGELGFSANGRSLRCAKLTEVGVRTRIWRVPD